MVRVVWASAGWATATKAPTRTARTNLPGLSMPSSSVGYGDPVAAASLSHALRPLRGSYRPPSKPPEPGVRHGDDQAHRTVNPGPGADRALLLRRLRPQADRPGRP